MKKIHYYEAIKQALKISLKKNKKVLLIGLGVDDPKGVFGTTLNLHKNFRNQVFDMPTAENGFTGFALGLATKKYIPVLVHQRVEFSLLSFEQIVNQISKWNYMSAGKSNVPITIRLVVGKGWGQGPQHSQSLETLFAHIPGLKVVCPSNPIDAKGMLISSIFDNNPVIFFEHRWLHNIKSEVPNGYFKKNITKSKLLRKGKNLSIISFSNSLVESLKAADFLKKKFKITSNVLDLRVIRPLDKKKILKTTRKTKNILIVDNGMISFGISSEISSLISENSKLKKNIKRLGVEETPIPSSVALAKHCYPEEYSIVRAALELLKIKVDDKLLPKFKKNPDQPDTNFKGPF